MIRAERPARFPAAVALLALLAAPMISGPAWLATGASALAQAGTETRAERVVSLGGGVSEIVHALGETDRLVARDTTSTYPESVVALPDVGYIRALSAEGVLSVDPDLILAKEGAGPPEAVGSSRTRSEKMPYQAT